MYTDTQHGRDPFEFSLRGFRAVGSHAIVPVIADDGFDRVRRGRARRLAAAAEVGRSPDATRRIEGLLARYFAHGCCTAA